MDPRVYFIESFVETLRELVKQANDLKGEHVEKLFGVQQDLSRESKERV